MCPAVWPPPPWPRRPRPRPRRPRRRPRRPRPRPRPRRPRLRPRRPRLRPRRPRLRPRRPRLRPRRPRRGHDDHRGRRRPTTTTAEETTTTAEETTTTVEERLPTTTDGETTTSQGDVDEAATTTVVGNELPTTTVVGGETPTTTVSGSLPVSRLEGAQQMLLLGGLTLLSMGVLLIALTRRPRRAPDGIRLPLAPPFGWEEVSSSQMTQSPAAGVGAQALQDESAVGITGWPVRVWAANGLRSGGHDGDRTQQSSKAARRRRARRGLRRHRHQPAVRVRGGLHRGGHALAVDRTNVFGVCSLAFWSLLIIISVKYLLFVMRADNNGEGGILALTALVMRKRSRAGRQGRAARRARHLRHRAALRRRHHHPGHLRAQRGRRAWRRCRRRSSDWVIPIAVVILIGLFAVQRRGTGAVGKVFGPIMMVWFAVLGLLGLSQIADAPGDHAVGQPALRSCATSATRPRRRSCRSARSSWSSPAARRCTPTWATSAGGRSRAAGTHGAAVAGAQLLGPGRASCCATPRPSTSVFFRMAPEVVAAAAGDPGHDGHDHRVAGAHLGRVLAHRAGGAARLPAAHHDRPHLAASSPARSTCRW